MIEIETLEELDAYVQAHGDAARVVMQGLDLSERGAFFEGLEVRGSLLLGCVVDATLRHALHQAGAVIFPRLEGLPYDPYRNRLYAVEDLYEVFDRARPESYLDCLDARVYAHWKATGRDTPPDIRETLARSLHDHAMKDALEELLQPVDKPPEKVVAIMGGHSMGRDDPAYRDAAFVARAMSRKGFLLASGGGPGAMEAAHLGPWLVDQPDEALDRAVAILSEAPRYDDALWLSKAFEVRETLPASAETLARHPSVGIPTWLYGHEPPNAFASHLAKFFANAIREDGLLAIAKHGIVFTPGSAGTIQEIFQDACQNHYVTTGSVSPMIFLDRTYWTETKPVYPLLAQLAEGREYAKWLSITDDPQEVIDTLLRFDEATS